MDKNRDELLRQLSALDFMLVELNLFLNTHPNDQQALARFYATLSQAQMLRRTYEGMYGPLTVTYTNAVNEQQWQWICKPWPWQYDFNFTL